MMKMRDLMIGFASPIRRLGLALLMAVTLVSCAVSGDKGRTQAVTAIQNDPPPAAGAAVVNDEPPQQTLTDDLMFDILLAEIAGQRGAMETSGGTECTGSTRRRACRADCLLCQAI